MPPPTQSHPLAFMGGEIVLNSGWRPRVARQLLRPRCNGLDGERLRETQRRRGAALVQVVDSHPSTEASPRDLLLCEPTNKKPAGPRLRLPLPCPPDCSLMPSDGKQIDKLRRTWTMQRSPRRGRGSVLPT